MKKASRRVNLCVAKYMRMLYWDAPRRIMPLLIKIRFRNKFTFQFRVLYTNGIFKLEEVDSTFQGLRKIYFYHPLRVTRYFSGIDNRLDLIMRDYCVNQIKDLESGNFIDIGSNVGEFSLGISRNFPDANFFRFEPSPEECKASTFNMMGKNDHLIPKALWKESTILPFYNRNKEGDSSLFSPDNESGQTSIMTSTLDAEMDKFEISVIQILKLEAEGAEPEILLGGESTLRKCRYVTADLGPERGVKKEETFEASHQILMSYGFSLVARNSGGRRCFLYKNSRH
jgi:FkbM family methyltransferase